MTLEERIKEAVSPVYLNEIYGPHSKYDTWRGKYYRMLQLLMEIKLALTTDLDCYPLEDIIEAFKAGVDAEYNANGCGADQLYKWLHETHNIELVTPQELNQGY